MSFNNYDRFCSIVPSGNLQVKSGFVEPVLVVVAGTIFFSKQEQQILNGIFQSLIVKMCLLVGPILSSPSSCSAVIVVPLVGAKDPELRFIVTLNQ